MKIHYWNGKHTDAFYPTACGKRAFRWPFRFWQQRKWRGVNCKACLATRKER